MVRQIKYRSIVCVEAGCGILAGLLMKRLTGEHFERTSWKLTADVSIKQMVGLIIQDESVSGA